METDSRVIRSPLYERFNSSPLATRLDSHGFFLRFLAFSLPFLRSFHRRRIRNAWTKFESTRPGPRKWLLWRKGFITGSIDRNSKKLSLFFDDPFYSPIFILWIIGYNIRKINFFAHFLNLHVDTLTSSSLFYNKLYIVEDWIKIRIFIILFRIFLSFSIDYISKRIDKTISKNEYKYHLFIQCYFLVPLRKYLCGFLPSRTRFSTLSILREDRWWGKLLHSPCSCRWLNWFTSSSTWSPLLSLADSVPSRRTHSSSGGFLYFVPLLPSLPSYFSR